MDHIIDIKLKTRMLKQMLTGRKFEQKIQQLFSEKKLHGTAHLDIGEEAVSVGVINALKPADHVFSMHRGHVQAIAKGISVRRMMAEL